jgi:plastocyanin
VNAHRRKAASGPADSVSRSLGGIGAASLIALCVLLVAAGCSREERGGGNLLGVPVNTGSSVDIVSYQFEPGIIEVPAGTLVTWANDDPVTHTVTGDVGCELDSGDISPGESYSHIFGTAGTFYYHDSHDPTRMIGKVVVR